MLTRRETLEKQKESASKQWDNIMRLVEHGVVTDRAFIVMVMDLCNTVDKKIIEENYKDLK